jgi:hypothetical protein
MGFVTFFADPSIRDGKGLSYTDLVEGKGIISPLTQQPVEPQPQAISVITPQPSVGRAKKGGGRGGSEAEDEDDEGEVSALDQKRRRQQRRHRKEQGGGSPTPARAATASGTIDHAAGVEGAALVAPEVRSDVGIAQTVLVAAHANSLLPPAAPDLESMLQVARESLAAAAASGDVYR